jgi:hypothetical protein
MPSSAYSGLRIFVVGAGFSRPAGLPLGTELYSAVRETILAQYGRETKFSRDVHSYLRYCESCGISGQTEESVDLESLMAYLDIEHYLGLRGSDTWSLEGNESQLMIRKAIGQVIQSRTPDRLPDFYYRFAENLSLNDIVLSLNYDLILETALRAVGKSFRRYPYRHEEIRQHTSVVDNDVEELVLLKLHGSIDWFDNREYLELEQLLRLQGSNRPPHHSVFADPARYRARPLVDGPLPDGDALCHIHWIEKVGEFYERDGGFNAPYILSPSHVKFVYAQPILSFWRGLGRIGGYNLGLSIIGFSLPPHDEYIRIAIQQMVSNYGSWWTEGMPAGAVKDYTRFVDCRPSEAQVTEYLERYRFADRDKSRFFFDGFGPEAVGFLFDQKRTMPIPTP